MSSTVSFKFIIVGSGGVGKTAILKRLIDNIFSDESQSTIGVEFETVTLMVDDRKVKLLIWDTAGQERFRSIAKSYYRNAVGVILVFDVTDRRSFDDLAQWLRDIHTLCDANAIIQLIGNKADQKPRRLITISEAEEFASRHKLQYIETSAKLGDNVREAFVRVATTLLNKGYRTLPHPIDRSPLTPDVNEQSSSKGCC
jgi:small GTP-binding protein